MFPGDAPGDGQTRAAMKKIFRYLILLANLSLHAAAWGDMADNGVECSVVMEKTQFDARETFPDFKLVFTNKGEKTVRLFDDFYLGIVPCIQLNVYRFPYVSLRCSREKSMKFPSRKLICC